MLKQDYQVNHLIEIIKNDLNEGIMYYDKEQITDHPERFIVAELLREKSFVFHEKEEIPHSVAIVIDRMAEVDDGIEIIASIIVY